MPKALPKKTKSGARDVNLQFASKVEVQYIEESKTRPHPVAWFWRAVETEEETQSLVVPGYPFAMFAEDGSLAYRNLPDVDKEHSGNHCDHSRIEVPDERWCDVMMERLQSEEPSLRDSGLALLLSNDEEARNAELPGLGCNVGDVILPLALSSHGYRVIVQALAVARKEDQAKIIYLLRGNVQKLVASSHGHEVLQSCVERAVPSAVLFIVTEITGSARAIAKEADKYQLICRLLEYLPAEAMESLVEDLLVEIPVLCRHPRANHVVQHLLEYGSPATQYRICTYVAGDLLNLAKHRTASHVVEKAVDASDLAANTLVAQAVLSEPSTLLTLACHRQSQFIAQRLARRGDEVGYQLRFVLCANMSTLTASKYGSRCAEIVASIGWA